MHTCDATILNNTGYAVTAYLMYNQINIIRPSEQDTLIKVASMLGMLRI